MDLSHSQDIVLPTQPPNSQDIRLSTQPPNPPDIRMLPQPPDEPLPSDCCGTGCVPCVFDIYDEDLKRWKKECQRLLQKDETGTLCKEDISKESPLSTTEYRPFKLEDIHQVTKDSFMYRFNVPGGNLLGLKVGQHIILRGTFGGQLITRQYTPVSPLDSTGFFDVLIKIYENGKMSSYVKTWKVGDMIEWRGPFGKLIYSPNKFGHICMLAAGTGIAPMTQVLQEILDNEKDDTVVRLLYACRTYDEILLKELLDRRTDHWNFNVLYAVSRGDESSQSKVRYGDRVHYGRIDQDLLSRELPSPGQGVQVLICGTKSFDKDMIKCLSSLGFTHSMYFKF